MEQEKVLKKNKNFYCGVIFTVLEGLLSGSNFMVLYAVMQMLYRNEIRINTLLTLTGILAGIYFLRLFVYSFGYTQGQIGGAKVSKNIRLHLGDKIKKIPLSKDFFIFVLARQYRNSFKMIFHVMPDTSNLIMCIYQRLIMFFLQM